MSMTNQTNAVGTAGDHAGFRCGHDGSPCGPNGLRRFAIAAVIAGLAVGSTAFAAAPPNDDCVNAQAISGPGAYPIDLTEATVGVNGVFSPQCDLAGAGIDHDIWFCWTSGCNGLVEFSTCGTTQVNTKIRIYQGCACPNDVSDPLCCSDDDCGKQTKVICDAVCGQTYLIQIGTPSGEPGGPATLNIACLEETCSTGEPDPDECACCGERPPLVETLTTPFNPGLLAATTNFQQNPADPAVYVIDLGNQGSAPLGTNWATQRYSAPDWTMAKLGGVFGVTLDNAGNVYVAHTSVYGQFGVDPLGSLGGAGSIYVLNGTSGAAAELVRLPNQLDRSLVGSGNAAQAYPGLGNLTFGCASGRLYAANMEDGRIYSIDPSNSGQPVRDTFDITTNAITGPLATNNLAEPGDVPGWVPLRQRPYALKVLNDRLYYSVWNSSLFNGGIPNEIWSVQVTGAGDFVANTKQLELVLPVYPGASDSNPVVDITFDDQCCMLVAERGITELWTTAHSSRVMKFCRGADGTWAGTTNYAIGETGCIGSTNSAGGVGFEPGNNMVWAMGDALRLCSTPIVYGLQGQPVAGAPSTSSILVDLDGVTVQTQKNDLGSLEVNCLASQACMELETEELLCKENGSFSWTFTLTNLSGQTAAVIVLPDPNTTPNVIPLNPPLASGSSTTQTITINGQQPGSEFCFDIILGSVEGQECCHITHCIQLPDCECAQTSHVQLQATSTPGVFSLTFDITNLEAWNMGHVVLFPSGTTGSVSPSLVNFAGVPTYGTQTIGPVTVTSGMSPGDVFCITIGQHSVNWLECCFIELCVTVPDPTPACHPADINCDGVVDAIDLGILLGAWGTSGPGDFNLDGVVNAADLAVLLGEWGR
ncbi:MAG: hypothetical protein JNL80_11405 [Phycisphaerae bacterium]|nr:hypothetical protein [Phycisphaerae bacterium]